MLCRIFTSNNTTMENKKSISANLEKSRKSFLMIGVAVATGLVLMAFEWSTVSYKSSLEAKNNDDPYEMPFTAPDDIIILIDAVEKPAAIKEKNIDIIEVTEKTDEIETEKDIDEDIEVDLKSLLTELKRDNPADNRTTTTVAPIDLTDPEPLNMGPSIKVPYYDYCADESYEDKIACISKEIHKSINKGMSSVTTYQIESNKKSKMYVRFVIGKDGLIEDLTIAGEENFNKSIVKMVKKSMTKVPQMHPALFEGKPVRVYFNIPIKFNVQ